MCVKLLLGDLNPNPYPPHPTPHKHLYLWNDHRTKSMRDNFEIITFTKEYLIQHFKEELLFLILKNSYSLRMIIPYNKNITKLKNN